MAPRETNFQMTDVNHVAMFDFDDVIEPYFGVIERGFKRRIVAVRKVTCWKCGDQSFVCVFGKQGLHKVSNINPFALGILQTLRLHDKK